MLDRGGDFTTAGTDRRGDTRDNHHIVNATSGNYCRSVRRGHGDLDSLWRFAWSCHDLVNGDERSELRHQTVVEPESRDLFFNILSYITGLQTAVILRHQVINPSPRPKRRQRVVALFRLRQFDVDLA